MKAIIKLNFIKDKYKNVPFKVIKTDGDYIEVDIPDLGVVRLYDGEYEIVK